MSIRYQTSALYTFHKNQRDVPFVLKTILYNFDNDSLLFLCHIQIAWQTKAPSEDILADVIVADGDKVSIGIKRLQVHRFPYWTAFNIVFVESEPDFFWRCFSNTITERILVDC